MPIVATTVIVLLISPLQLLTRVLVLSLLLVLLLLLCHRSFRCCHQSSLMWAKYTCTTWSVGD